MHGMWSYCCCRRATITSLGPPGASPAEEAQVPRQCAWGSSSSHLQGWERACCALAAVFSIDRYTCRPLSAMTTLAQNTDALVQPAEPCSPPGRWDSLPAELLRSILLMALQPLPPDATAAGAVAGIPHSLTMREAGRLLAAVEGCCRSWRQVAVDVPLRVSLGPLPLPRNPQAALLGQIAGTGRRRLQALHFEAPALQRGCRPGVVQLFAIDLLASDAFAAAAGALEAGECGSEEGIVYSP